LGGNDEEAGDGRYSRRASRRGGTSPGSPPTTGRPPPLPPSRETPAANRAREAARDGSKEDSKVRDERNGGEGVRCWEGRTCRNSAVAAYLGKMRDRVREAN